MLKIKIISPGKNKDRWLDDALAEYIKRLSPVAQIEFIFAKDDEQFAELISKEKLLVCLDPNGKTYDSVEFANFLFNSLEQGGSRLAFAIGGAEGFPQGATQGKPLLSLSKMIFTHQMTRLLLVEQIFRAFEIRKGSKYHKD